jgi:hypothetical protein
MGMPHVFQLPQYVHIFRLINTFWSCLNSMHSAGTVSPSLMLSWESLNSQMGIGSSSTYSGAWWNGVYIHPLRSGAMRTLSMQILCSEKLLSVNSLHQGWGEGKRWWLGAVQRKAFCRRSKQKILQVRHTSQTPEMNVHRPLRFVPNDLPSTLKGWVCRVHTHWVYCWVCYIGIPVKDPLLNRLCCMPTLMTSKDHQI